MSPDLLNCLMNSFGCCTNPNYTKESRRKFVSFSGCCTCTYASFSCSPVLPQTFLFSPRRPSWISGHHPGFVWPPVLPEALFAPTSKDAPWPPDIIQTLCGSAAGVFVLLCFAPKGCPWIRKNCVYPHLQFVEHKF